MGKDNRLYTEDKNRFQDVLVRTYVYRSPIEITDVYGEVIAGVPVYCDLIGGAVRIETKEGFFRTLRIDEVDSIIY